MPPVNDPNPSKFRFGHDELGPAIADYVSRLHLLAHKFERERAGPVLFVARGGVRIRRMLDVFVKAAGLPPLEKAEFFWTSRLMAAKGVWNRDRDAALEIMAQEFRNLPLVEFVRAMFRFSPRGANMKPRDPALLQTADDIGAFLQSQHEMARVLQVFFHHQGRMFEAYVKGLLKGASTALLVDTGWQGRTQALLMRGFPEIDWQGAYFGLTNVDGAHRTSMTGVVFDAAHYSEAKPETSVTLNRHLIEWLFEPRGKSIEWLAEEKPGVIVAPEAQSNLDENPTRETDPMFCGALNYIEGLRSFDPSALREHADAAWRRIAQTLLHPSPADLAMFGDVERYADFGRDAHATMVVPAVPRFDGDTPARRIRDSLWPCGQIALEFPADEAARMQNEIAAA